MNRKMKKYISLLLSLTILLGCFGISFTAFGDDEVVINEQNFPDPVFMEIVKRYDSDKSGGLSAAERDESLIDVMALSGMVSDDAEVKTLKGIEYFADSLSVLRCGGINLEELDVSALYNLTSLTCEGNYLTSLDVSHNPKLITLKCMSNELTSLNLGNISNIETLYCFANSLESIDVSNLVNLKDFKCNQNELTSLDVSKNVNLQKFSCSLNHLRSLDLSNNTNLNTVVKSAIGGQTVTAPAAINGLQITVPFAVDDALCIRTTSLDKNDVFGYTMGEFATYDVSEIDSGIDYSYSVSNEKCEDMEVHIDVTRDFYQVSFYADEEMQELIGKRFVNKNEAARNPVELVLPQCKELDRWSSDVSNITEDIEVYAIWKDSHSYALKSFENGIATIACVNNDDSYTVAFVDCINATAKDSNYCEYLDVVADGYINAKDYAQLQKMF